MKKYLQNVQLIVGTFTPCNNILFPPPHLIYLLYCLIRNVGQDSSVGIATCYGLGGLGIESQCGRDLLHPSGPALGPTQPPIQWVPSLSRG